MSSLQVIPDGYKQTEVGMIPEDWDVSPLNEVCSFGGGTTPPRAQHDRYFVNGSNNWVKTTDLNNSLIDVSEEQITDLALSETGLKKHPVGSVLVAMYGGFNQIGRTGYLTKPSAINQALVAVKPKPKKINSYYLLSELNYNVDYWKGVASSSRKDPNITSNDVKNYVIALPSIEEQTAIANALSDVDALLSELEKLISKKQAIKTATMQQLLTGKTRLPQFATYTDGDKKEQTKGTQPSELGEIPEDWDIVKLGDIGQTIIGLTYSPSDVSDHGVLVLRSSNVQQNTLAYENNVFVDMDLPERVMVKEGDILVCVRNGSRNLIGKCALIDKNAEGSAFGAFMSIYRTKSFGFIFYQFQSNIIQNQINEIMGATINQITNRDMAGFMIPLPANPEEQTAIATILSDMDEEIQALKQRLSKTRQIKQGMMQELLTGKTRLIQGEAHD